MFPPCLRPLRVLRHPPHRPVRAHNTGSQIVRDLRANKETKLSDQIVQHSYGDL
jgi:hypothetical protein